MHTFSRTSCIVKEEMAKPGTNHLLEKEKKKKEKNGPKRFFRVWHFKVIVWRSLALIVFLTCVFIRFRAHVESSLHGFS